MPEEDAATTEEMPQELINGEWLDEKPSLEEVMRFLKAQKPVGTIDIEDYAAFVMPLSRNKNLGTKKDKDYHEAWNLYTTVAGRVKMFNDDMDNRGLDSIIEPDPSCSPSGWVYQDGNRLVYRVKVTVKILDDEGHLAEDVRYGTAYVPWVGGAGAVETNRYEKVETSATGRALAAFGYGVLPGSGIASLEEMEAAAEYQAEPQKQGDVRKTKAELIKDLDEQITQLAGLRGQEPMEIAIGIADWVKTQYKKDIAAIADAKQNEGKGTGIWWEELSEGQLVLVIQQNRQAIIRANTEMGS